MSPLTFARAARETPYYKTILPATVNYYETDKFVFTHGWIPCSVDRDSGLTYMDNWRKASEQSWRQARWINGIDAARTVSENGKTIVCLSSGYSSRRYATISNEYAQHLFSRYGAVLGGLDALFDVGCLSGKQDTLSDGFFERQGILLRSGAVRCIFL